MQSDEQIIATLANVMSNEQIIANLTDACVSHILQAQVRAGCVQATYMPTREPTPVPRPPREPTPVPPSPLEEESRSQPPLPLFEEEYYVAHALPQHEDELRFC